MQEEDCSICYDPMLDNVINLQCDHKFHKMCINKWKLNHNTCPLCRGQIYQEKECKRQTIFLYPDEFNKLRSSSRI